MKRAGVFEFETPTLHFVIWAMNGAAKDEAACAGEPTEGGREAKPAPAQA
jgi:hypothetical protein